MICRKMNLSYRFAVILVVMGFWGIIALKSAEASNSSPAHSGLLISGGMRHSLGLKSDGTVWAWGWNRYGQLGNGSNTDSNVPVQAYGLNGVMSVSAGGDHSVALKPDGTVWVWGDNTFGQCGTGNWGNTYNTPIPVPGLTGIVSVSAGGAHSLALKADGTVWAWGWNSNGQLGNATTTDSNVPVQVWGLTGVRAIYARGSHSIALTSGGTVWSWGDNDYGQLGNGTNLDANVPVQIPGLTGVTSISAGSFHSLALKSNGTLSAWGRNNFGQFGNGNNTDSNVPVQVPALSGIKAVSAGGVHSLALMSDGTVRAWGYNYWGQLGNGNNSDSNVPAQVPNLTEIVAVSGGLGHSIALKSDGTMWIWGADEYGQLGDWCNAGRSVPSKSVNILLGQHAATSGGEVHSLAVKGDGTVWGWGSNDFGQIGSSRKTYSTIPLQVAESDIYLPEYARLTGVVSVSGGQHHSLALKADGTVWAWGDNQYGQRGPMPNNIVIPLIIPNLPGIVSMAAGENHSLAIKADGTVWAWGRNNYGQLGNGIWAISPGPLGQVSGLEGIVEISAGVEHSIALKSDGTVWTWGRNQMGQLGIGNWADWSTIPLQVSGLTEVVAVSAGGYHSLALKSDGTVWAWGFNIAGQLGNGNNTNSNIPVKVVGLSGMVSISASHSQSFAVKSDGTVWGWGYNIAGQLGNGSNADSNVPVQVSGLTSVVGISSGYEHSLAVKSDGNIWAWGFNAYGQLGVGYGSNGGSNLPLQLGSGYCPANCYGCSVKSFDLTADESVPVTVTFQGYLAQPGSTTITSGSTGVSAPSGFALGSPPTVYEISTTASYSGSIRVCINYSGISYWYEKGLRLLHNAGTVWVDITDIGYPDTLNDIICGTTTSLSPFLIAEPFAGTFSGPAGPVAVGTTVSVNAHVHIEESSANSHIARWEWGDGNFTVGALESDGTVYFVSAGLHAYSQAGVYTVTLHICDLGGIDQASGTYQYVVVYDPDGGFATGGGSIDSPAGAYYPDPTLMGKADFGFVSKYLKGATVPSGVTEFQFHVANMNFHSESYDWLVVNQNGTNAQFKGSGTINGNGLYKFMLWAGDGIPDTFRFKIWYESTGIETVIYDNSFNQAISGGSIVIHAAKR